MRANYYRGVCSKDTFSYIQHRVWQSLWQWAKRRHPAKTETWVKDKYFHQVGTRKWVYTCEGVDGRGSEKWFKLFEVGDTPIIRHIKLKESASPDNPQLKEYWEDRRNKQGKQYWAKGSKYYQVGKNQDWKCPVCGDYLFNGEDIKTHHIAPVKEGGMNDTQNLAHLHKMCHKQEHS